MVGVRFSLNLDGTDDGPVLEFDDGTQVRTVEEMAAHPHAWVRQRAAWDPTCPVELLEVLARDPDPAVRAATCSNLRTPGEVRRQLAYDPEVLVRRAAAREPTQPSQAGASSDGASIEQRKDAAALAHAEVLAHLARDDAYQVRAAACEYLRDPHLLTECAHDPKADVRKAVAANLAAPGPVLAQLSTDRSKHVRAAVAANPITPATSLEVLSEDKQADVRQAAWLNPNAPIGVRLQALRTSATRRQILDHLTDEDLRAAINESPLNIHGRAAAMVSLVRRDPSTDLGGLYRHDDQQIRKAATRAIAQLPDSVTTGVLLDVLNDPDLGTVTAAQRIQLLIEITSRDDAPSFMTFAEHPAPYVRTAARAALPQVVTSISVEDLNSLVTGDIDQDLRVGVLTELLSRAGAPDISVFLEHERGDVRLAAQQVFYNTLN